MSEDAKQILEKVWSIYDEKVCKNKKPDIEFRRQHATALYWKDKNKITIREDSWNKMHPAEKRLTVIHETLHVCGIPHREGFRTSQDYASLYVYEKVYGKDFIITDFEKKIKDSIEKYLKK